MGNDQRGFPRSLVDLVVKTRIADQWVDSKVLDLSAEGLSLKFRKLQAGELSAIGLEHSEWMKKNQVQAEVLRCDSNPDEKIGRAHV